MEKNKSFKSGNRSYTSKCQSTSCGGPPGGPLDSESKAALDGMLLRLIIINTVYFLYSLEEKRNKLIPFTACPLAQEGHYPPKVFLSITNCPKSLLPCVISKCLILP